MATTKLTLRARDRNLFNWLMPWIEAEEGDFIGYVRYEEAQLPTLILKR